MKKYFTKKQINFIFDTTCKYGHLLGFNTKNNCYKCSDCGKEFPLKKGEKKPLLISEVESDIDLTPTSSVEKNK